MPARADDFPKSVVRLVAERAGQMCSSPTCGRGTSGPHSDPTKSVISGKAAHICAAQQGGPRYDPNQTAAERRSIDNAVWLCSDCAAIVDRDEVRFPALLLREWRRRHEARVRGGELVPPLPGIIWETSGGLSLPIGPAIITGEHVRLLREHTITITYTGDTVLHDLHIEAQLPEPALFTPPPSVVTAPAGVSVECLPAPIGFKVVASGAGSSVQTAGADARGVWTIGVDRLIPSRPIRIKLWTRPHRHPEVLRRMPSDATMHYLLGRVDHEHAGARRHRDFVVPLSFDEATRTIASLPMEETGRRRLVQIGGFGE